MNDLSNGALLDHHTIFTSKPIPSLALYILISLFFIGLSVSIFILIVVHNAAFFVSFLLLSFLVLSFIVWNTLNRRQKPAISFFLRSFPDSDLGVARDGQLVKITGQASCGSVYLESSYEKATRCIYTSTLLYEYGRLGLKPVDVNKACFQWGLAYCELTVIGKASGICFIWKFNYILGLSTGQRFSTDFYITDQKSGVRAMVKGGPGCKVLPLMVESSIVTTTRHCRILSTHLRKWLRDRNLPVEPRQLRLEEGYIQEGSSVTVIGMLRKNNDVVTIVQPPQLISTGCLWQRLLLPVEIDGLVLGVSNLTCPVTANPGPIQHPEQ
ncbi:hypothetical protein JRO89_XS01G0339800 [Xanthoceras sorbifolium]|uniref:Ubiquitin-specific protease family C19-related protein n=1 Tax=Xanthoceras sorbifolium TaxID=99658 RepID=A0ABQ8IP53_9ROSI|nr:hypothetical protein JRO89_XS01G0339800 [Xanthoceras sorbifolium]